MKFFSGSPLLNMLGETDRGPIQAKAREFKKPVLSHDVEIRQWLSVQHGLDQVQFGIDLALNRKRLRTFPASKKFGTSETLDPWLGNIKGALEYLGTLLHHRSAPGDRELATKLRTLSGKIEQGAVSKQIKSAIKRVLIEEDVESKLTLDLFLK